MLMKAMIIYLASIGAQLDGTCWRGEDKDVLNCRTSQGVVACERKEGVVTCRNGG